MQMERLLQRIAKRGLTGAQLATVNGSEIYQISAGWQKEILAVDESVITVRSLTELQDGMRNEGILMLLVSQEARLTQSAVEAVLNRSHSPKTIVWETA